MTDTGHQSRGPVNPRPTPTPLDKGYQPKPQSGHQPTTSQSNPPPPPNQGSAGKK